MLLTNSSCCSAKQEGGSQCPWLETRASSRMHPVLGWGYWETWGLGSRACHLPDCPGRRPFPKRASLGAERLGQRGWGGSCPLRSVASARSKREDSPASVITSCPGLEKAPGGEGEGAAAMLASSGCPSLPVGMGGTPGWQGAGALVQVSVRSSTSSMQAPWAGPGQCGQPCLAAAISNLGLTFTF